MSDNVQIGPPKLTRFERVRIVGARALQLSLGAPMLIELPPRVSDPFDIALAELKEGVLPVTIRRTLPDGTIRTYPSSTSCRRRRNRTPFLAEHSMGVKLALNDEEF